ncbi:unnamed protein product [Prorocentrum cordatum]|uniref:Uncharacterized protein n=1 Tax=Prorocentrum cordatum TaxID=2364126 RepID=A0ABN9U8Q9_9DINO|nr:unnamed protein product [Polarella glacialis]
MDKKDTFVGEEAAVSRAIQGSTLGRRLFGKVARQLEVEKISVMIEQAQKPMTTARAITKTLEDNARKDFIARMKSSGRDPNRPCPKKKQFKCLYRRLEYPSVATSPMDQYGLQADAIVKGQALDWKLLPPMWAEGDLVPAPPAGPGAIYGARLAKPKASRKSATAELDDTQATSTMIKAHMKKKSQFLNQTDRMFRNEMFFWQHLTGMGVTKTVQDSIVGCFGTPETKKSMEAVTASLQTLASSKLFAFSGPQTQNLFTNNVKIWMDALTAGKCPKFDKLPSNAFLLAAQAGMLNAFEVPCAIDGDSSKFTPHADGVNALWGVLKGKPVEEVKFQNIQAVVKYGWALSKEDRAAATTLLDRVAASAASSAGVVEESNSKVKKADVNTKAMVRNLFKEKP